VVEDRSTWLHRGLAALAVAALGVGVAGSVSLTGAAQSTSAGPTAQPSVVTQVVPGVKVPDAFDARTAPVSRGNARPPVAAATGTGRVSPHTPDASAAAAAAGSAATVADSQAVEGRADALAAATDAIEKQDDKLVEKRRKARAKARAKAKAAATRGCIPVVGGYTIAARFGDVGAWARYHTGFDFSAPMGTKLRAPAAGTVMNAGIGPASGWAGNYVVIKQPNGTQVLMAHMSRVNVKVGQKVSPCDPVGAVGQTGRAFGPHLHFEVYPAGIEPGDVYKAVDPLPWLTKMHIKP
jgi:murein DD-endopeptidase MepM/ murein hydrolase activator NlpD